MGFGLGLGSFVDGFAKGLDIAGRMDERKRSAERFGLEKQQMEGSIEDQAHARDRRIVVEGQQDSLFSEGSGDRAYARDREKLNDTRSDAEFARGEEKRTALEGVSKDTTAAFDKAVTDGTADPNKFDEFWTKYALPRQKAILLQKGDTAGAAELEKWGMSEDAIKGGRLFSSALLKAQSGDPAGALQDAIAAGQVGGYIANGYEVAGQEEMKDKDGNLLGYRLTLKDQSGKEMRQDIAVGDVPKVISTFLNPEVAWQSQQAAAAETAKTNKELAVYEEKKKIDAKTTGLGGVKQRGEAIKALRERYQGMGGQEGDTAFDNMTKEQQERLIAQEVGLQTGQQPVGLGGQVLFDEKTGKAIAPGVADPNARTGRVVPPNAPSQGMMQVPVGTQPAPTGSPDPNRLPAGNAGAASADAERAQLVQQVPALIEQGTSPVAVAQRLIAAGIPPEQWQAFPMGVQVQLQAALNAVRLKGQ